MHVESFKHFKCNTCDNRGTVCYIPCEEGLLYEDRWLCETCFYSADTWDNIDECEWWNYTDEINDSELED